MLNNRARLFSHMGKGVLSDGNDSNIEKIYLFLLAERKK